MTTEPANSAIASVARFQASRSAVIFFNFIRKLRSSLGGSGDVTIASALCDGPVIYAVQKPGGPAQPVARERPHLWPDRPIVVLVNELTVSAGEDLALALRELSHAKIVGRPTGGALTEFSFKPLAAGYALAIPLAVVLGPVSGQDQPGHAVVTDFEIPNAGRADVLAGRDPQLEMACRQF